MASPIFAYWLAREQPAIQRRLAWLIVFGAIAQVGSGLGFGLTSYLLKGHLPEVEGVAYVALLVKVFCVVASPTIMLRYVLAARTTPTWRQNFAWLAATLLGSTAFTAAAFLRWYL